MTASFDQLLNQRVGGFGKWQVLFLLTMIPVGELPVEFFTQFAFLLPEHHCRQPRLVNLSWAQHDIVNLSIPLKPDPNLPPMIGQAFQPCTEYDLSALWPHLTPDTSIDEAMELRSRLLPNLSTRACSHGVTFNPTTAQVNGGFGVEFQIVCSRQHFIVLSNSAYVLGMAIGSFLSGPLADNFGRRRVCLLAPIIYTLCGLATALVQDLWSFVVLRIITASGIFVYYITYLVLASEWTTSDQRNMYGITRKIYYGLIGRGFFILCFYTMPNWRYAYALYFVLTLPLLAGYFLWLESPRWLLSRGRVDEAHALLLEAMRWNHRYITEEEAVELKETLMSITASGIQVEAEESTAESGDDESETAADRCPEHKTSPPRGRCRKFLKDLRLLLTVKRFRGRFLLMCLAWSMHVLVYYGLSFNAVRLEGNPFLIAFLVGIMSIPGNVLQYLLYRFFDRKWPMATLYMLCSVMLLTAFILTLAGNRGVPTVVLSTIGVLLLSGLFTMLYIRTPEIFPTSVRSTSFGLCSAISRLGMVAGVFTERLDEMVWPPLPMLIFTVAAFTAAVATAFLPGGFGEMEEWEEKSDSDETKKKEVPTEEEKMMAETKLE